MVLNSGPIFYVDDDRDDLDIFHLVTASLGIEARLFEKPDKMLKALLNPPPLPSIIFVDINMPVISGYEIIEEVSEMEGYENVPIVVLTTAGNDDTISECKRLGVKYFIQKPTSIDALKSAVNHLLHMDWEAHDPSVNFVHAHNV